jgi:hypothetical protein
MNVAATNQRSLAVLLEHSQSFKLTLAPPAPTVRSLQYRSLRHAVPAQLRTHALTSLSIQSRAPWERTALLARASAQYAKLASFARQLELFLPVKAGLTLSTRGSFVQRALHRSHALMYLQRLNLALLARFRRAVSHLALRAARDIIATVLGIIAVRSVRQDPHAATLRTSPSHALLGTSRQLEPLLAPNVLQRHIQSLALRRARRAMQATSATMERSSHAISGTTLSLALAHALDAQREHSLVL